jgi:putative component of toxin-antitoxin plasmid stabilization module
MKCSLVKLEKLSGNKASIYSLYHEDSNMTLFEKFLHENKSSFKSETKDIFNRLIVIGNETGARIQFFKENEGNLGDGVCALYDDKSKNLRLYCVRFGMNLIVLGGGGFKPKSTRSLQETKKLKSENYLLRQFVSTLVEKMKEKEIKINRDGETDFFEGDLEFDL